MRGILARGLEVAVKGALAAVLLGLAACRPSGDPVKAALDSVADAARARDADKLLENVAPDFQGADGSSRAEVESTIRRLFAAYEILDVVLSDVTIERGEGRRSRASRRRCRASLESWAASRACSRRRRRGSSRRAWFRPPTAASGRSRGPAGRRSPSRPAGG